MSHGFRTPPDEPAWAAVDLAVQAVLDETAPERSLARALERAQRWEAGEIRPLRQRQVLALACVVVASVTAAVVLTWQLSASRRDAPRLARDDRAAPSILPDGSSAAESIEVSASFFESGPVTHALVSPRAPVFITAGPEHSVVLGSKVRRAEIFRDRPEDARRLHVWDWSESDRSRVVTIPRADGRAALSPDGGTLLYSSGVTIDLATSTVRPVGGFETRAGERIVDLEYSPKGQYALAWIETKDPESKAKSARLRLVDMDSGTVAHEFDAGPEARFLPDEESLVYSRPHPEIPRRAIVARRDLESGEELEYEPRLGVAELDRLRGTYGTFDVVGIAVSSDGQRVAVGYYYGQVAIWETETGEQISRTQLRRADGTADTFFQAEVMRFSPEGDLVAAASGSRLEIISVSTGEELAGYSHEAAPRIVRIDWADSEQLTLLSDASIGDSEVSATTRRVIVTADILPRVYVWSWKTANPVLQERAGRAR